MTGHGTFKPNSPLSIFDGESGNEYDNEEAIKIGCKNNKEYAIKRASEHFSVELYAFTFFNILSNSDTSYYKQIDWEITEINEIYVLSVMYLTEC